MFSYKYLHAVDKNKNGSLLNKLKQNRLLHIPIIIPKNFPRPLNSDSNKIIENKAKQNSASIFVTSDTLAPFDSTRKTLLK